MTLNEIHGKAVAMSVWVWSQKCDSAVGTDVSVMCQWWMSAVTEGMTYRKNVPLLWQSWQASGCVTVSRVTAYFQRSSDGGDVTWWWHARVTGDWRSAAGPSGSGWPASPGGYGAACGRSRAAAAGPCPGSPWRGVLGWARSWAAGRSGRPPPQRPDATRTAGHEMWQSGGQYNPELTKTKNTQYNTTLSAL